MRTLKPFFVFLLGVILGFLIKWLLDFYYWRERYNDRLAAAPTAFRLPVKVNNPARVEPTPEPVKEKKPAANARPKSAAKTTADNLKIIKGIGPVIERKLNEAGIHTFKQLATLKADELRDILGKSAQRLADEDDLLKQARNLTRKK